MTDIEKVIAFLDDMGVEYHINREDERLTEDESEWEPCMTIILKQGDKKVGGYGGFFVDFEFNPDGSLAEVGAWE